MNARRLRIVHTVGTPRKHMPSAIEMQIVQMSCIPVDALTAALKFKRGAWVGASLYISPNNPGMLVHITDLL
jgi:hypothetical protein